MKIVVDFTIRRQPLEELARRSDVELVVLDPPAEAVREVDPSLIRDADALFCTFPPANLASMERLKWVQIASTGYTQLFGLGLSERDIRATNARGCFDVPIAEWNIAMMVCLARNVRQMIRHQEAGVWDRSAEFQTEIRGKTVGIWGYGGIGRETARLARQFGLRVHVMTRSGVRPRPDMFTLPGTGDSDGVLPHQVFCAGEEEAFLGGLDFLIVAMPLTHQTRGCIGAAELRRLPPHAFLLNPARGPIIDQQALLTALGEHWFAGAALDAHYDYPMSPQNPFWKFPQVMITPHISGSSLTPTFAERMWSIFMANVDRFAQGEPLLNQLSVAELSGQ
ncbi:D-2-hydroxyacid dehydrogenase [Lacipirellula parvula]|uniref:D-3-phosphoglycerate dehydrogenase n=1 Tax=Lacipirellula parvula TaxID=2650471 RepID=A0A5K7X884_9BACT|nr:D-2-hydroxyacid dehydrogenase [Lacipirellula parvula]BBO32840.1 D-3-phosphoglycerate dehydrogenase [Lacipirellula parvula]